MLHLFIVSLCIRVSIQEQQGGGHKGRPREFQTITKDAKFGGQTVSGEGINEVYRPPRVAPVHYAETKRGSRKIELELQQNERRKEVRGGVISISVKYIDIN